MFTGIIIEIGKIKKIKQKENGVVVAVDCGKIAKRAKKGASISNSGVCLTVIKKQKQLLYFDVMPETLKKTTLGQKNIGDQVNLESTLKIGDELGGHFVYGHIDGVGEVASMENQGDNRLLKFALPTELMKYIAPQGSIAIDGVSLTIASFDKNTFTISLIPFTLKHTTLGKLKKGDKVNLEMDMLIKYINNLIK